MGKPPLSVEQQEKGGQGSGQERIMKKGKETNEGGNVKNEGGRGGGGGASEEERGRKTRGGLLLMIMSFKGAPNLEMGKKEVCYVVYSDQRTRAESQRIVETSLLCPLQCPVLYISSLQRIVSLLARSEIAIQLVRPV